MKPPDKEGETGVFPPALAPGQAEPRTCRTPVVRNRHRSCRSSLLAAPSRAPRTHCSRHWHPVPTLVTSASSPILRSTCCGGMHRYGGLSRSTLAPPRPPHWSQPLSCRVRDHASSNSAFSLTHRCAERCWPQSPRAEHRQGRRPRQEPARRGVRAALEFDPRQAAARGCARHLPRHRALPLLDREEGPCCGHHAQAAAAHQGVGALDQQEPGPDARRAAARHHRPAVRARPLVRCATPHAPSPPAAPVVPRAASPAPPPRPPRPAPRPAVAASRVHGRSSFGAFVDKKSSCTLDSGQKCLVLPSITYGELLGPVRG